MSHQIVLERTYTIPFFPKLNSVPRTKRASRAMKLVREFIIRHMKAEDLLIDPEVNEFIFSRGMQKPPRKITVRALKGDDDLVEVYLVGGKPEEMFEQEPVPVSTEPSEEEIDLEEEDFEEEEE